MECNRSQGFRVIGYIMLMIMAFSGSAMASQVVAVDRHLVKYDTGVVFDSQTGLEWYAGPDRATSWEEARQWASDLDAQGGGWRMPTLDELDALHAIGDGVSNITLLMKNSGYWIWSGQTAAESGRWVFSFSYGGEGWPGIAPSDGGRAVAVRYRTQY